MDYIVDIIDFNKSPEPDEHWEFETTEEMFKEMPVLRRLAWLIEDENFVALEYQIGGVCVTVALPV